MSNTLALPHFRLTDNEKIFVPTHKGLSLVLTNRCNFRCRHCFVEQKNKTRELKTKQLFDIIDEAKKLEFKAVALTGGEPFLRKDIFDLIEYVVTNGFLLHLNTNGSLITKDVANRIKKIEEKAVNKFGFDVSLNAITQETSKRFTNTDKLDDTLNGINNLIAAGITPRIQTVLTRINYFEVFDILKYISKLGIPRLHTIFFRPVGNARGVLDLCLTFEELNNIHIQLLKLSRELNVSISCELPYNLGIPIEVENIDIVGCYIGERTIIMPNGDMVPCYMIPDIVIGNIKNTNIDEALEKAKAIKNKRKVDACKGCKYERTCNGGCFACTYYLKKDINKPDPFCPFVKGENNEKV